MVRLNLDIDYSQLQTLEYQLNKCHGQIVEQQFSDRVRLIVALPASEKSHIQKQFTGF